MASTPASAAATMGRSALLNHRRHPYRSLAVVFGGWKAFLLAIAVVASLVGPAYDTSGDLLEAAAANSSTTTMRMPTAGYHRDVGHDVPSGGIVSRLTSWDAIYYVQAARRGHIYEQEWAFGAGLPMVVSLLRNALNSIGVVIPVAAIAVAYVHVAHLLSVLLLYKLGRQLWLGDAGRTVAFVAACLHVLSPAGLFLSAPYAESSCALFSFAGYVAFAAGRKQDISSSSSSLAPSLAGDLLRLLAGVYFGLATVFRSNGLLNGVIFAYEAVAGTILFVRQPSLPLFRRLAFLGLGGLSVAAGSVIPQTVAYFQFCSEPSGVPGEDFRPWCKARLPSIYTFVQDHYWGSGRLFKYWTLSNLPLFLLATPMLLVLMQSSIDIWQHVAGQKAVQEIKKKDVGSTTASAQDDNNVFDPRLATLIQCMAISQLILAVLAFTSYHVQIVSRLSSAYPIWYWWLAQSLAGGPRSKMAGGIVVFMVMYASIQGILFASFLPPA